MEQVGSGYVSLSVYNNRYERRLNLTLAYLYAVEILPLQYRSQAQSGANMLCWLVAFLAVYFGGQAAGNPTVGALIYIWFCVGGGISTVLAWLYVIESKSSCDIHAFVIY